MVKDLKEIITENAEETKALGEEMAKNVSGGEIFCLKGELGAGKTTFSQGFLRGLGIEGALTSPTFVVMKEYMVKNRNIYHIDTYRVESEDILNLGWEEIINKKDNIVLVEWPEKIKDIIPENAIWINFRTVSENKRIIELEAHA